jgi:hypothetical protein
VVAVDIRQDGLCLHLADRNACVAVHVSDVSQRRYAIERAREREIEIGCVCLCVWL